MLQNAYFLAKIGADTAENEQHFAEILPIGRRVADRLRLVFRRRAVLRLPGAPGEERLQAEAPGRRVRPPHCKMEDVELGAMQKCAIFVRV